MGSGDRIARKVYMRQHSTLFRKSESTRPNKEQSHAIADVVEDDVIELHGKSKLILRMICRNKQRLLLKGASIL
jgi:hypothetical protein